MYQIQNQIEIILNDMSDCLSITQMKQLQETLVKRLEYETFEEEIIENNEYLILFLSAKQVEGCSKRTIDNIRRNLSSFFSWLEEENHILRNPIKRIKKIKSSMTVKEIISDEKIEIMRDASTCSRDLAIIDMLYSTEIRVGELVNLDISDINFHERECVVYGKGDKERRVYFDAKTKLHLEKYISERNDYSKALFVTLNKPYSRLQISGVEIRIKLNLES